MTAAVRCARCGRGLPATSSSAPRLVLLCKRCRSAERPTEEELAAQEAPPLAPARGLDGRLRRWRRLRLRPRMMLRLLLFALALCVGLIRLLER